MNLKTHPVAKTSIDVRRSINRLKVFQEQFPFDPSVQNGTVEKLIEGLRTARNAIPKDLRDPDLLENQADAN